MNDDDLNIDPGEAMPAGSNLRINPDTEISEGNKLLGLDNLTPTDFIPRNALVTVRRLGKLDEDKVGAIMLPASTNKFDVAKIILVGPGTPGDIGIETDTHDLKPGQLVLIKVESQPRPGMTATTTLKFRVSGESVELMNQHDILAILETPKETPNGES